MDGAQEGGEEEEDSDLLLQRIKKEPVDAEEDDNSSFIQIRVNASAPRQKNSAQTPFRVRGHFGASGL